VLSLWVIALAFGTGCAPKGRSLWPATAVGTLDQYYDQYLTGDTDQARRALKEAIALMQSVDSRAHGRAHGLWLGYARLFALEKHAGHDADSWALFDAAKVWYRKKLDASGEASQEIASALEGFTPVSCLDIVRRFDAAQTKGKGPSYVQAPSEKTMAQQDGVANGSHPIRSGTNRTSSAAGSRR
jgi:uncharacterized protein involved in type VI secretion and phage assembly